MLTEYQAHGILQIRIPEWVAIPSPGDPPDPGIEPGSPALLVDSLLSVPSGKPIRKLLGLISEFTKVIGYKMNTQKFLAFLYTNNEKSDTVSTVSPSISHEVMGPDAMNLVFWMLSFKPIFSLSSFTFIKRLFSSSSLSAIRVVSSAYSL